MMNKIRQISIIAAITMLALGAVSVQKIASADTATTTFPNYAFIAMADTDVNEEMSETIQDGSQQSAKTHTTATFPNYAIINPVSSINQASSRQIAAPKQGFSPWVQTTRY